MRMINKVYIEYLLSKDDQKSFHKVINIIQPKLIAFATGILKDKSIAEDAVQDSMIAIIKGIRKLNNHRKFHSWVYQVTRNKCLDIIRKNQKYKNNCSIGNHTELTTSYSTTDEQIDMMSMIKKLSDKQRNVIHLFYYDGFNISEISEILKTPAGTIKSLLFDARKNLKQLFGEQL